jgi:hypothetical protein
MKVPFASQIFKFCFLSSFFLSNNALCQLISIPLEQRIDNANVILEGKVTSKTSYWNETHTQIYTSNVVSVYKVFKGSFTSSEVEIITPGGIVGQDMEQVSHSLQLNVGDVGIFTVIPNTVNLSKSSNLIRFKAYSGLQGFIKYDLKKHTASDPFTTYKNISSDVYNTIKKRTKINIMTIKKADFNVQ